MCSFGVPLCLKFQIGADPMFIYLHFLYLNSNYTYIMLSNGTVISNKFQRMWKEVIEAYFKTF